MMDEIDCRTAQRWLQSTDDLVTVEHHRLDDHLLACAGCAEINVWQHTIDNRIRAAVQPPAGSSVRLQVRDRILAQHTPPAAPTRRRTHVVGPAPVFRRWRSALLTGVAAATAFVVAILAAQLLPGSGGRVQQVGAAWHLVRPEIGYPVALDPTRPNHLLAGAWGQVYESRDAGEHWRPLGLLPPHYVIRALAIDRTQPSRYLVATKWSVFVSQDAGHTWIPTATSLPGAMNMFLEQDQHDPAVFYLGPGTIWKSVDHGATWSRTGPDRVFMPNGIQALEIASNGTLMTGIWGGGVAFSSNGGRSWLRRSAGLAPNVMDVAASGPGTLWAATDRGLYRSTDAGLHWSRVHHLFHLFATSLAAGPGYVLVGGNGAVYRSRDGGAHWSLAMNGLPLDPYLYNLIPDPYHRGRVYASLNSDGVFRSDDGGRHWKAVDGGLPLHGTVSPSHPVLFTRGGALWITNSVGTDPSVLTVDRDVRLAALSPDGAAIAYLAGDSNGWSVRLLSAGGSAARTFLAGDGATPNRLLWSPSSALLAILQPGHVTVTNLAGKTASWALPGIENILGWRSDGQSFFLWNAAGGRLEIRSWAGRNWGRVGQRSYPAAPHLAPDGRHIAYLFKRRLYTGTPWERLRPVAVAAPCRFDAWSSDSSRLLLTCGGVAQVRSASGTLVRRVRLSAQPFWAPGSHRNLLFFRRGALWRWAPSGIQPVVTRAAPIAACPRACP